MIVLYDCATAPSPRRYRTFLAENGGRHDTLLLGFNTASATWHAVAKTIVHRSNVATGYTTPFCRRSAIAASS